MGIKRLAQGYSSIYPVTSPALQPVSQNVFEVAHQLAISLYSFVLDPNSNWTAHVSKL